MNVREISKQVIGMLFATGAYKVRPNDPFILIAKTISPDYIDNGAFTNYPDYRKEIASYMVELIDERIGRDSIDIISGGLVRDLVFSITVADLLDKPYVIIREEAKLHGVGGKLVGNISDGQKVLHIADLITDGKSALEKWLPTIREGGGFIKHYIVNVDRIQKGKSGLSAEEALKKEGVTLHSLVKRDDKFYETAVELGLITEEDWKELEAFNKNPRGWGINYLRNHPVFVTKNITAKDDGTLKNKDGILMFTEKTAYPELRQEFGPTIRERLKKLHIKEAVPEFGYNP